MQSQLAMYLGHKAVVVLASVLTVIVLFVAAMRTKHQQHTLGLYRRRADVEAAAAPAEAQC